MRRGDEASFVEFVNARSAGLHRFAYLLVGNDADAQDLLQTALVKLARRWPGDIVDPNAYVKRSLINLANSSWRAKRRRDALDRLPTMTTVADPADGLVDADALVRALHLLPQRQRLCVVLRYVEGMSEREAADHLGCSLGTVKSHTSRGLARLRELLADAVDETSRKALT